MNFDAEAFAHLLDQSSRVAICTHPYVAYIKDNLPQIPSTEVTAVIIRLLNKKERTLQDNLG